MTKTIAERILHAASKETVISNTVLRRRMRIPRTEMNTYEFNNTVLRTARYLNESGELNRVARGKFVITRKGAQTLA